MIILTTNTFLLDIMDRGRVSFEDKVFEQFDIKLVKLIGRGNWSDVYLAFNLQQTEKYAIKVISQKKFKQTPKIKVLTQGEKQILKSCKHPNVVKFIKSFVRDQHQFIVLQYCDGGDLGELLQKEETLSQNVAIKYIFQILNGFKGLHSVNAMHRDFKVQNVMLHDQCCKIVDLGFGKQLTSLNDVAQTKLGSNLTMAPQVMQREPYGIKADIWSIGVVFYQLLQGTFPFKGRNVDMILQTIKKNEIVFEKIDLSEESKDFIKRCLVVNPKDRISWNEIYQHPLFNRFNSNKIVNNSELICTKVKENKDYYEKNQEKDIFKPSQVYKILDQHQSQEIAKGKNEKQSEKRFIQQDQQIKPKKQERSFKKGVDPQEKSPKKQVQLEEKFLDQRGQIQRNNHFRKEYVIQIKSQIRNPTQSKILQNSIQSYMNQEYFKQKVNVICQRYLQQIENCRFAPLLLYEKHYFLRANLQKINHQYYLSMLWKDSFIKLQALSESLKNQVNIFGFEEEIKIFFIKHKTNYVKILSVLMNQIKDQFATMVNIAKQKCQIKDIIFNQECLLIQGYVYFQHKCESLRSGYIERALESRPIGWKEYLKKLTRQYWRQLAKERTNYQEYSEIRMKLLVIIFCLAEFQKNDLPNILSYRKVDNIINKFNIERCQRNIGKVLCQPINSFNYSNQFNQFNKPYDSNPHSHQNDYNHSIQGGKKQPNHLKFLKKIVKIFDYF